MAYYAVFLRDGVAMPPLMHCCSAADYSSVYGYSNIRSLSCHRMRLILGRLFVGV